MRTFKPSRRPSLPALALLTLLVLLFAPQSSLAKAAAAYTAIHGSTARWIGGAHLLGRHAGSDYLTVGLVLRTSYPDQQAALLNSLYLKGGPAYHHWLTPAEFSARFAPAAGDVAGAKNLLLAAGLRMSPSPTPTLLLASGTFSQVEAAFHITINDYRLANGNEYFSNSFDAQVPSNLRPAVLGVFGLSNFPAMAPHDVIDTTPSAGVSPPPGYGGGPHGSGLTPSQVAGIYNATPVYTRLGDRGQGENSAVFELAGYRASDVTRYETSYSLHQINIVNKPVLGGASGDNGAAEVELDIELQIAMAPRINDLFVYEAPNTELGALTQYQQMAKDNTADVISSSWGIACEYGVNSQITLAENQIFLQMATQGQSLFSAAGDAGAYGCSRVGIVPPPGQLLQIGDPNNQPYNTAVGGTSFRQAAGGPVLFDPGTNPHPTYPGTAKEGTWLEACAPSACEGGAGGVSRVWAQADYAFDNAGNPLPGVFEAGLSQSGAYCGQQAAILCRENPDVSLDADPGTGYAIYCTDPGDPFCAVGEFTPQPGWVRIGGTSCSAPLWAGIAVLADSRHEARLGLFNYTVYPFDSPAGYASQFHDITKYGNGFYPAGPAYDLATGIGTPDIFNLVAG